MSDETLPPGWALAKFEDLLIEPKADLVDGPFGSNLRSSEYIESGVPVLKIQNIKADRFVRKHFSYVSEKKAAELSRHSFVPGDLMITKLGDPLGLCCEVPKDFPAGVFVADLMRLRLRTTKISKRFVLLAINSHVVQSQFKQITKGTTRPRVNLTIVRGLEIPLPPLAEQKRIVAKIEELFSELEAGEESLRVARRQLGVYRQSLLQQAFEGKLTAKWRTQNRAKLESPAALPAMDGPHALPAGWQWIKLGSAIEEPAYGTSKKCFYESGGLGVLRIPNVVNGAIEADDLKFAEFTKDEREAYKLKAGDLLLIRSNGSVSIVGRCAIVEPKHTEFLYAGYLIRLRPRSALLNSRFLLSQLASHRLRSQIEFSAKSTSGVNNINSKEIQRLVLARPSLPEQQEIVRVLDEQFEGIGRNEREIDGALRSSAALRQSILQKAFTGRLVPQDAKDEPASELLARLRAERSDGSVRVSKSLTNRVKTKQ